MRAALRPLSRLGLCLLVGLTGLLIVPDRASAAGIVGAGTFENTSRDVAYSGTWTRSSSAADSGGSIATLAGTGYAELTFRETSVRVVARTASYLGVANVYLDGKRVTTVDLYSAANGYKKVVYTSPTLSYGTHTVRIERSGTKRDASSGRNIDVDAFVVPDSQAPATPTGVKGAPSGSGAKLTWTASTDSDLAGYLVFRASGTSTSYTKLTADPVTGTSYTDPGLTPEAGYRYQLAAVDKAGNQSTRSGDVAVTSTADASGAGTYENTNSHVVYSGTWATATSGSDSGGSVATLAGTGYAQVAFRETSISWVARKANYLGIANVYLDDGLVSRVDLYSAANQFKQVVYTSPTLSYGTHTLRIERSGDKNAASSGRTVDVDSFVVLDTRPPAPPTGVVGQPSGADAKVTWKASGDDDVAGYLVYRAEGTSTSYTKLTDTPVVGTTFTDPGPTPATVYRYRVTAVDRSGNQSSPTTDVAVTSLEAVGSGVYENTDAGISYSGSWTTSASASDSKASSAQLAGTGFAQLSFKETSFSWMARTGDHLGIANVWIDGKQVATVDLYTPKNAFKKVVYVSPTLSFGVHTVRIERSGNKNAASSGRTINLDKLYVNDTRAPATPTGVRGEPSGGGVRVRWDVGAEPDIAGYLVYRASGASTDYLALTSLPIAGATLLDPKVGPNTVYRYHLVAVDDSDNAVRPTATSRPLRRRAGTYPANDSAVIRTGSWAPAGDDPTVLTASGTASASLTFNETNVRWIGPKGPQGGLAKVYLDGDLVATVDQYASRATPNATLFSKTGLSATSHTLRVAWTGERTTGSGTASTTVAGSWSATPPRPTPRRRSSSSRRGAGVQVRWARARDRDVIGYRDLPLGGQRPRLHPGRAGQRRRRPAHHRQRHKRRRRDRHHRRQPEPGHHVLVPGDRGRRRRQRVGEVAQRRGDHPAEHGHGRERRQGVIYGTAWSTSPDSHDSGGSYNTGTATGASATLTFSGTGIKWLTRTNSYSGIASVSIDGTPVQKIDLYSARPRLFQQPVFTQLNLANGTHVIKIERTGTLNKKSTGRGISLDAFQVLDSTPPPAMPKPTPDRQPAGDPGRLGRPRPPTWRPTGSTGPAATAPRSSWTGCRSTPAATPTWACRPRPPTPTGSPRSTAAATSRSPARPASRPCPSPPEIEVPQRYANCPTATRTVSTTGTLQSALSTAKPGDVIRLAPGTYTGPSTITAKATARSTTSGSAVPRPRWSTSATTPGAPRSRSRARPRSP